MPTSKIYCIVRKPWYVPCNGLENWIVYKSCDDAIWSTVRNQHMVSTLCILVVLCKGGYHNWWVCNRIKFRTILHSSRAQKRIIKQVIIDRQASMVQGMWKRKLLLADATIPPHLQCLHQSYIQYHVLPRIEEVDMSDLLDECDDDVFVLVSTPMLAMRTLAGCDIHDRLRDPHLPLRPRTQTSKSRTCAKKLLGWMKDDETSSKLIRDK